MAAADWPGGLLFLNIYRHRNMFSMALPIRIHCSDVDGATPMLMVEPPVQLTNSFETIRRASLKTSFF
jgi:hypothetical protein